MNIECEIVEVEQYGETLSIYGYPGDYITECMKAGRIYESDLLGEIYRRYGTGGVYVDFGAFIGTHSLFFAKMCKADLVTAIEFNPASYAVLLENLQRNNADKVEPINVAVGKSAGRAKHIKCGINEATHGVIQDGDLTNSVPVYPASAFITAPPKLIKIDCENSSIDVLNSCLPVISEHKPVIAIESHPGAREEISNMLTPLGYKLYDTFCATPTDIWEPE